MKLNKLCLALTLITLPLSTMAAGLDRSGQSISAFLQPGNYAEAGLSVLDPTVKGKDATGKSVSDMGDDYVFASAAVKIQATDKISFGFRLNKLPISTKPNGLCVLSTTKAWSLYFAKVSLISLHADLLA